MVTLHRSCWSYLTMQCLHWQPIFLNSARAFVLQCSPLSLIAVSSSYCRMPYSSYRRPIVGQILRRRHGLGPSLIGLPVYILRHDPSKSTYPCLCSLPQQGLGAAIAFQAKSLPHLHSDNPATILIHTPYCINVLNAIFISPTTFLHQRFSVKCKCWTPDCTIHKQMSHHNSFIKIHQCSVRNRTVLTLQ